jgi:hypothetical protein
MWSDSLSSIFSPREITARVHWIGSWMTQNLFCSTNRREKNLYSTGVKSRLYSPPSLKPILILSSHLQPCFSTGLFPSACPTKLIWTYPFPITPLVLTYTTNSSFLIYCLIACSVYQQNGVYHCVHVSHSCVIFGRVPGCNLKRR